MRNLIFYSITTTISITVSITSLFCSTIYAQGTSINRTEILSITNSLEQLGKLLPGIYINKRQHEIHPTSFYHVMIKVNRIWADRDDALWFYVEKAQFELQDHPYQQSVYKIYRGERDTMVSEVYRLNDSEIAIGTKKDAAFWKERHPHTLLLQNGCALYLTRRSNGYFTGSTRSNNCPCSCSLESVVAMQSQISISLDTLKIWEKGFDKKGKQVWGSEKGAYCFERAK